MLIAVRQPKPSAATEGKRAQRGFRVASEKRGQMYSSVFPRGGLLLQSAPALKGIFPAFPASLWSCQKLHTEVVAAGGRSESLKAWLSLCGSTLWLSCPCLMKSKFGNYLSQPLPSLFQASHPFSPQALHTAWRPPKDRQIP